MDKVLYYASEDKFFLGNREVDVDYAKIIMARNETLEKENAELKDKVSRRNMQIKTEHSEFLDLLTRVYESIDFKFNNRSEIGKEVERMIKRLSR